MFTPPFEITFPLVMFYVFLQTEVGSLKMIDPKSMDDSYISDDNNADSDGDLPCFSDIDALVNFTIL